MFPLLPVYVSSLEPYSIGALGSSWLSFARISTFSTLPEVTLRCALSTTTFSTLLSVLGCGWPTSAGMLPSTVRTAALLPLFTILTLKRDETVAEVPLRSMILSCTCPVMAASVRTSVVNAKFVGI